MKMILYIFTAVIFLVSAVVYTVHEYSDLTLLIGNINGDTVIRTGLICVAICLIIIAVVIVKKEKRRIIKTVICLTVSGVILCFAGISDFFSIPYTYYDFTSPDGNYTVIAGEWSWLQGGGINFYERENLFFVKKIGYFTTDDGYHAIKNGDYSVEWNESRMKFTANNGNGKYETVEIKTTS